MQKLKRLGSRIRLRGKNGSVEGTGEARENELPGPRDADSPSSSSVSRDSGSPLDLGATRDQGPQYHSIIRVQVLSFL